MSDEAALEELRFLTRALRAHLEWQASTGATGLERGPFPAPALGESALLQAPAIAVAVSTEGAELEPPPMVVAPPSRRASQPSPMPGPPLAVSAPPAVLSAPPAALLPDPDAQRRLEVLAEVVRSCTKCALSRHRTQTVFARGTGSSGVCFVGEGPGADEDAQGLPFVGKAGQLLDRMIEAMGLGRDEVYVCNVVKCRPPDNRKPELDEMAACSSYLNEQLDLIRPRVIVALGATAVQGLFGTTEGITRLRGKWKTYRGQVDVMPTFHPAYLLRTPAAKREVWEDLQDVLRKIGRSVPSRR